MSEDAPLTPQERFNAAARSLPIEFGEIIALKCEPDGKTARLFFETMDGDGRQLQIPQHMLSELVDALITLRNAGEQANPSTGGYMRIVRGTAIGALDDEPSLVVLINPRSAIEERFLFSDLAQAAAFAQGIVNKANEIVARQKKIFAPAAAQKKLILPGMPGFK